MTISGIYAAMLTPLDEKGRVNTDEACRMTEFLIQRGVDGVFPVSNVGGQIQLSMEEKRRFITAVVRQARHRVAVLPGISAAGTRAAVELGQFCEEAGADGAVLSAPFYFPYPQEVVRDGLAAAAKELRLPIVLYNIPLYANPIGLDTLRFLLQYETIIGMKDSSGSIAALLDIQNLMREEGRPFHLLVGWEEMLFSALELGADGCMTASACIFPEVMAAIRDSIRSGKRDRALTLQRLIAGATQEMKSVFFPYGYQLAMEARGFSLGPYPVTLSRSYGEERNRISRMVERTLEKFLAS